MNKKQTILIVDDTPVNIQILTEQLGDAYTLKVASNGERALKIAENGGLDLILLDIMMPGIDGYEVCKRLKEDSSTAETPIIFLTAKTQTENLVKGFELGAVDYIKKPFQPNELLARVKTHLALKRSYELINQKNEELARSNGQQQELLHVLCHDLTNPIGSILSIMSVVNEAPEDRDFLMSLIKSSAGKAIDLIDLTREMCRLDGKPIALECLPFSEALDVSLEMLDYRFKQKDIQVITEGDLNQTVQMERLSMSTTVINNLLTNAIKFSPRGAKIYIKGESLTEQYRVTIRDQGIGIPKEILKDIFEVGASTSRQGTEQEVGTGFGMPLVKKFMNMYQGHIDIKSKTEGSQTGTIVELIFPSC